MKVLKSVSAILGVIALMSFTVNPAEDSFKIDTTASQLKWTGYHLAKSYEHWGYVKVKSGSIKADGEKITSGQLVIDMTTISNKDVTKEKENKKFVNHLKSDDFFNVKKFPEAKLAIKKSEKTGDKTYKTTADLTIRGITKEITFDTKVVKANGSEVEAIADLRVQRTDFKVMYGWKIENAVLDGEFRMEVKIVAKK